MTKESIGRSTSGDIRANVETRFEREASFWSDVYRGDDVLSTVYKRRHGRASAWAKELELQAGSRVLEVGCGAGLTAVALAQLGLTVEATDAAGRMVELARDAARRAGCADRVTVTRVKGHALPYHDESFPLVVSLGVIPWLYSPDAVLAEIARVLETGGHLIISADNRWRLITFLDPLLNPALAPLRRVTKSLLARLGLWDRSTGRFPPFMHARKEFERLLLEAGLEPVVQPTLGFGPVTFMRRKALPDRLGRRLDSFLQALAERGVPGLRSTGAQHMMLARKVTGTGETEPLSGSRLLV